jgi:hypothetical protein
MALLGRTYDHSFGISPTGMGGLFRLIPSFKK